MANKIGGRLLILSLAQHAINNAKNYSYEPYVREVNLWCELFDMVDIYTQIVPYNESNKHSFAEFKYNNVALIKLWSYSVGSSVFSKIAHVLSLPLLTIQLLLAIHKYDLVHIRNSSFPSIILGLIVRIFKKKTITKWAGGFGPYPNEPLISKLDRKVAGMPSKYNKTLIYSKSSKNHLVTFIPALMSSEEIRLAQKLAEVKPQISDGFNLVSIGRLHPTKNFELIPEALHELMKQNPEFSWHYDCIGDGDLMQKMRTLVSEFKLEKNVTFHGSLKFKEAQKILAAAHVLIMPGVLEGWPKPIAEAWAHNTFPIAANRGNIPDILDNEKNGMSFNPDAKSLANTIIKVYKLLSCTEIVNLKDYANELSLERFKHRLQSEIKSL